MTPKRRAQFGKAAVDAGTPDRGQAEQRADAIEAVANVLHFLDERGEEDPAAILASAATHFFADREPWTPVEYDEGVLYLESATERIGPYSREQARAEAARLNEERRGRRKPKPR